MSCFDEETFSRSGLDRIVVEDDPDEDVRIEGDHSSGAEAGFISSTLIAVFPANVFMYQHPEKFGLSPTLLLLRLPLQVVLILWAYAYTRR